MNPARLTLPRPVPEGWARRGPICAIPAVLAELGLDPRAILDELGVPHAFFDDPELPLRYADGARLLRACVERTGCDHFGLLVGRRCGLNQLGMVGRTAALSADVEAALQTLIRYLPLFDRGAVISLRAHGAEAAFSYGTFSGGMEGADQLCDVALTVALNTLKSLCGPGFRPKLVTFPHKAGRSARAYGAHFGADLRFDAEEAAIVFERAYLKRPLPTSSPTERAQLLAHAADIEARLEVKTAERVRRQLRAALAVSWLSQAEVAKQLLLSERTLRLRLADEGVRFRQIVDELQFETARQYLATSGLELDAIAPLLGYADATAFNRAFRRWSGMPPGTWRAARRQSASSETVQMR